MCVDFTFKRCGPAALASACKNQVLHVTSHLCRDVVVVAGHHSVAGVLVRGLATHGSGRGIASARILCARILLLGVGVALLISRLGVAGLCGVLRLRHSLVL